MSQVDGLERVAAIGENGLLAIAIVAALLVVVIIVYTMRNQNTDGLTDALQSLSEALKSGQTFQGQMEIEFRKLVGTMTELLSVMRDLLLMRGEVTEMRDNVKRQMAFSEQTTEAQQTILIRLANMESRFDNINSLLGKIFDLLSSNVKDDENA